MVHLNWTVRPKPHSYSPFSIPKRKRTLSSDKYCVILLFGVVLQPLQVVFGPYTELEIQKEISKKQLFMLLRSTWVSRIEVMAINNETNFHFFVQIFI